MRKLGWIIGLIVAVALGLLVLRSMGKRAAERKAEAEAALAHAMPVQTARVELGDIEATIETSGTIAVREEADIVAKIPGRVASVLLDEGDAVRAGQVVVRLEQDDVLAQVAQAKAAASEALALSSYGRVTVSPMISEIDPYICVGCQVCRELCPYSAIEFDERRGVSVVNEAVCKGCGSCAAYCPSGAAKVKHFSDKQLFAEIDGLLDGIRFGDVA